MKASERKFRGLIISVSIKRSVKWCEHTGSVLHLFLNISVSVVSSEGELSVLKPVQMEQKCSVHEHIHDVVFTARI